MVAINKRHMVNSMDNIIEKDCIEILRKVDFRKIKDKKILITGANGFLGQYITNALSFANDKMSLGAIIHAIGFNEPKKLIADLLRNHKNIKYTRIDLTKSFKTEEYDYIFHGAGYSQPAKFIPNYNETIAINIDATRRLLDTSPKATFIFFSSAEIYGDIPQRLIPVVEEYNGNPPLLLPRSVYAESKRLGEALCASYKKDRGTNIKIVRISAIYGPGLPIDDKRVMSEFIKKALTEKEINLLDVGKSIRTYGYIADSVAMILFIGLQGKDFVYNVGGKDSISILNLAKKIAKSCGVKCKVPYNASRLIHIGKDPHIVKLNLNKIRKEMGEFKFMPFDEGLKKTIEWTKQQIK